jgi:A/G-specific adenine glycosylase
MSQKISKNHLFFTEKLLEWNRLYNNRKMPWKFEKDPYKIWISEIILQQTRVEQGTMYYNNFIKMFPNIIKLASASDAEVYKVWEGLGYYSRCRNLIATAKFIANEMRGVFPKSYDEILSLKGIGPYTAAAISSFAFNLPYAVVDGNVMRVLSRFFGISTAIDSNEGKKTFNELANLLLDKKQPAIYNQAIMDFGATVCKPQLPLCNQCNLASNCFSYKKNKVNEYPVKEKKLIKKERWFYYFIVRQKDSVWIRRREKKDIWQNLYEFVLLEKLTKLNVNEIIKSDEIQQTIGKSFTIKNIGEYYRQQLTHQTIHALFIEIEIKKTPIPEEYFAVKTAELEKLSFPKIIKDYIQKNTLPPSIK